MKLGAAALSLPPVFYDIEASGLEGVPIEIGWAVGDPVTGRIQFESHLIRPVAKWDIDDVWDEAAEQIHGISRGQLYAEGSSPGDILQRMNEVLGGSELYSDAPAWDRDWLHIVIEAAGVKPRFSISRLEAHTLIGIVVREQAWAAKDCLAVMDEVARNFPRTHRAAADARHLAGLWLAMRLGSSPKP